MRCVAKGGEVCENGDPGVGEKDTGEKEVGGGVWLKVTERRGGERGGGGLLLGDVVAKESALNAVDGLNWAY